MVLVLVDTFDGPQAARLLADQRVTHTFGSDEMYRSILDTAPADRPFPAARLFGFGAFTSSFSEYAREACARGIPLAGLYGSSEVLALFSCQPMTLPVQARIEGGGLPVAGSDATVRIRDVQTGGVALHRQRGSQTTSNRWSRPARLTSSIAIYFPVCTETTSAKASSVLGWIPII